MIDSYNDGGTFWINMVCQDCGLEGGSYTDEVQWEDEGILQASPQIAYNIGNPNFGALKCSRCMQRFEMAAETFSKDFTFNIDIDEAIIDNTDELEEMGYSEEEIEELEEEIANNVNKDELLQQIKDNDLDAIGGDTMDFDDGVYLKSRDKMVDDISASLDYHVDAGGWNAESSSSLQSFAAEVFEADRKIRRRTRWTWTRGQESGFGFVDDDISSGLPYDIDYQGKKGRGYRYEYVPIYSIEDSYHISDLPEGYHLHLYKPALRSSSWKAFSKSPTSDWEEYNDYKKSNLTGELLSWYNQDIAKPEQKTLSPIEKLMISKGMKSGTIQIERIVIPKTKYTPESIQYFAFGGRTNMKPTKLCEIQSGVISLETVKQSTPNLFAFAQGLKFMTEKAGTLRSVNRFNKDPEAWVKSYPAWFQNAVKNKLTDIDVEFMELDVEQYNSGIKINDILVLKFLNGADRYSWRPINESERKVIDTPYGEMPQFEIYELDLTDPAPITPRPSTMQKIYAKSFKQNLSGDWKFDKEMFMMAVVDKYKFENGGSERIHNSMSKGQIWVIAIIPYMTPMAELMARRFKKNEN